MTTIIVSEAVAYTKPDPQIFEIALKALNVKATETVFVGDNPIADIDGAAACGMRTVFVPGFFGNFYAGADATCSEFSQLGDIVLRLLRQGPGEREVHKQ
ncbi:MAG: hypothetical protein Cons2KO_26130 [Congregibacter sp.]